MIDYEGGVEKILWYGGKTENGWRPTEGRIVASGRRIIFSQTVITVQELVLVEVYYDFSRIVFKVVPELSRNWCYLLSLSRNWSYLLSFSRNWYYILLLSRHRCYLLLLVPFTNVVQELILNIIIVQKRVLYIIMIN